MGCGLGIIMSWPAAVAFQSESIVQKKPELKHIIYQWTKWFCSECECNGRKTISNESAICSMIFSYKCFRSAPCFGSQRNFSVTSSVLASAVENLESKTSLQIPEVPATPTAEETIVEALAANGEPTFASLGLGGHSPIGLLQSVLEFMHVSCGLPWYVTIALSTVLIRILLTPLVVISQRNAAVMRNVMPEMQEIQNKLTESRQMGNAIEYAQRNQELMQMMKEKGFNPLKNMLIPFAQMPIFVSYFLGIRRMVNAPVESLHTGGALWFTDLTLADPYYLLPIITCSTLALTIHLGTEAARVPGQESPMYTYILKGIPIIIFPFIMNFPAAMVVYWASSNFCSLLQVNQAMTTMTYASILSVWGLN